MTLPSLQATLRRQPEQAPVVRRQGGLPRKGVSKPKTPSGAAWESNPPWTGLPPNTGFEDRAGHQTDRRSTTILAWRDPTPRMARPQAGAA
jgi:hypothetical protein